MQELKLEHQYHEWEQLKKRTKKMVGVLPEYSCLVLSPANLWQQDINMFQKDSQLISTIFNHHDLNKAKVTLSEILFGINIKDTGIRRYSLRNKQRIIQFSVTLFMTKYDKGSERDDDKWEKERGGSKWDDSKNQNQYSSNSNNTNSNSNNGVNRLRRYSFNEDNLPEWATENLSETRGGTFDSNGAYHGVYSDDENDNPRKSKDPGMNENRYYASQSGGTKTGASIPCVGSTVLNAGLLTFFPVIQEICIFGVIAIVCDLFLQMVFFVTVLSLDIQSFDPLLSTDTPRTLFQYQNSFHSKIQSKPLSRLSRSKSLSKIVASSVISNQKGSQQDPMPKRVKVIHLWARTRIVQRMLMFCMVSRSKSLSKIVASSVISNQKGSQQDPMPKRVKVIHLWARTRIVQRMLMFCMVMWIGGIIYSIGMVHFAQSSEVNPNTQNNKSKQKFQAPLAWDGERRAAILEMEARLQAAEKLVQKNSGTRQVYKLEDQQLLFTLHGHCGPITTLFIDGVVLEAVPIPLIGHPQEVECIATDGNIVISSCLSGEIRSWDAYTGEQIDIIHRTKKSKVQNFCSTMAMLTHDLLITSRRGSLVIINVRTAETVRVIKLGNADNCVFIHQITPLSDGIVCDYNNQLRIVRFPIVKDKTHGHIELWEISSCKLKYVYKEKNAVGVTSLKIIDTFVVAARLSGILDFIKLTFLNNASDQNETTSQLKMNKSVHRIHLRTGSAGSLLDFKKMQVEEEMTLTCCKVESTRAHHQPITVLECVSNRVITGSQDHTLKVYKLEDQQLLFTLHGHCGPITTLFIDGVSMMSGSGSQDGLLCVWDTVTGACMYSIQAHDGCIHALTYSDSYVISLGQDERLCVWDRFQGHLLSTIQLVQNFCSTMAMLTQFRKPNGVRKLMDHQIYQLISQYRIECCCSGDDSFLHDDGYLLLLPIGT
ncbi:LOW QUALITY PROTEIN: sterol regulatory element-binding protein cleavage-activating protein [Diaphorina citri]|uniref:Sterol regulatory element-binding protein cleavage-activating protein n=1 Tax=Diaphorina citri TaxID=121845 RepID=A0A3Q0ISR2_DIACI|nr:LOW QUALITY PROTEIN: sterol regulatory element-binding protein cleavage-activating protein [Diaphorina citri]